MRNIGFGNFFVRDNLPIRNFGDKYLLDLGLLISSPFRKCSSLKQMEVNMLKTNEIKFVTQTA
jgi:hypothetical protein